MLVLFKLLKLFFELIHYILIKQLSKAKKKKANKLLYNEISLTKKKICFAWDLSAH